MMLMGCSSPEAYDHHAQTSLSKVYAHVLGWAQTCTCVHASLPAVHVADCTCACMQRYGKAFSVWVGLLMVLNMGIAMTAEYTAVGDLFELVIGANRVPIVVIIGVVSMLYTAYGGLYVSIITDQWQAWPLFPHICAFLWTCMQTHLDWRPCLPGASQIVAFSHSIVHNGAPI